MGPAVGMIIVLVLGFFIVVMAIAATRKAPDYEDLDRRLEKESRIATLQRLAAEPRLPQRLSELASELEPVSREKQRRSPELTFPEIGLLTATCPNCHVALSQKPTRKTQCPSCQEDILVKTRPGDRQKVLVTQAEADQIETQWAMRDFVWRSDPETLERYKIERRTLEKQFGHPPSHHDILWGLFNARSVEHAKQGQWGLYCGDRYEMFDLLRHEGNLDRAFDMLLEVVGLGINGPSNAGPNDDDPEWRERFPLFNPKEFGMVGPGTLAELEQCVEALQLRDDEVRKRFLAVYKARVASVGVPLSAESAWVRFEEEEFRIEKENAAQQRRNRGRYWYVIQEAEAALRAAPPRIEDARKALKRYRDDGDTGDMSTAKILRLRGEVAMADGNTGDAIKNWKDAVALDPKVGIKRRLDALVKNGSKCQRRM